MDNENIRDYLLAEDKQLTIQEEKELLHVTLNGFEGPLDILLLLAQKQKIDLIDISLSLLVDQYLDFIQKIKKHNIDIAADYLVMACQLVYLKSRLFLPNDTNNQEEETSEETIAARLRFQLQRLESFKLVTGKLFERPQYQQNFYYSGSSENSLTQHVNIQWSDTLYDILSAYGKRKTQKTKQTYHITPPTIFKTSDTMKYIVKNITDSKVWHDMFSFCPHDHNISQDILSIKASYASVLSASLELVKNGKINLKQQDYFSNIYIKALDETHSTAS